MSKNVGGFKYEQSVIESLKEANISGDISSSAGADSSTPDADFVIGGKRYLLEIKKDATAQMGGTSVKYVDGKFSLVSSNLDVFAEKAILSELSLKEGSINNMLEAVGCNQFPLTCDKDRWTTAKNQGFLKPINTVVKHDVSFIVDHYKSKNVHYMQIGESGLFYLGANPANLPIPKLEGEINIEIRAGRSGSKVGPSGKKVIGGGLRVQGRLKLKQKSPFTFDNVESTKKMLKCVDKQKSI